MVTPVMPTYARAPMTFVEGSGSWLIEQDGTRYLDFGAGIAVNSMGHAHPALVSALEGQARRLWHTSNLYNVEQQEKLAELVVEHSFGDTMFFTNSGTEAMECAVKMARKYHSAKGNPERHRMITFEGSFHGRTLGMISAVGSDKLVDGFGPLLPGFDILPFGDHEALKAAITDETAAIVIEPIQGEGGIRPVPNQCMQGLRELCDEHGLLLVLDEIQCGVARTGRLFAHELAGITPDIMAVAKGIGGGFPLGLCLATEEAASGMVPGTHGSTYGGNPLACAVGCAVMNEVTKPEFLEHVSMLSGRLTQGLDALVASHPTVFEEARGEGLMRGLKCKVTNMDVVNAGYGEHLLTVPGGDNVVRLLPPLTLSIEEMEEALARLDRVALSLSGAAG